MSCSFAHPCILEGFDFSSISTHTNHTQSNFDGYSIISQNTTIYRISISRSIVDYKELISILETLVKYIFGSE